LRSWSERRPSIRSPCSVACWVFSPAATTRGAHVDRRPSPGRRGAAGPHPQRAQRGVGAPMGTTDPCRPARCRSTLRSQARGPADAACRAGRLPSPPVTWAPRCRTGRRRRRPTAAAASSWPARPTSSGRPTSPPSPPWRGSSTWPSVLDVFSRRNRGLGHASHCARELVLTALEMAIWNRRPARGVIHHSDHGCQYTSLAFGARCSRRASSPPWAAWATATTTQSRKASSPRLSANCWRGNGSPHPRRGRAGGVRLHEGFYNPHRRHSTLGYQSPAAYERRMQACVA